MPATPAWPPCRPSSRPARHLSDHNGSIDRSCRYEGVHNGAAGLFNLAGMAAGIRMSFLTTAETLELTVASRAAGPDTAIDLCIGNDLVESQPIGAVGFPGGSPEEQLEWAATWSSPTTLTYANLPAGQKRVELWLPHVGIVKIVSLAIPSSAQVSRFVDIQNDEYSIQKDEFSIQNDDYSIQKDEFSIKNDFFIKFRGYTPAVDYLRELDLTL